MSKSSLTSDLQWLADVTNDEASQRRVRCKGQLVASTVTMKESISESMAWVYRRDAAGNRAVRLAAQGIGSLLPFL